MVTPGIPQQILQPLPPLPQQLQPPPPIAAAAVVQPPILSLIPPLQPPLQQQLQPPAPPFLSMPRPYHNITEQHSLQSNNDVFNHDNPTSYSHTPVPLHLNDQAQLIENNTGFSMPAATLGPQYHSNSASLYSSPLSTTPNCSNELIPNFQPPTIPNEENSITPPNIFEAVSNDKIDYSIEVPGSKSDLKIALYKDSVRKISLARNDLQLPSYSSDSPIYDKQTPKNEDYLVDLQQQQQNCVSHQSPSQHSKSNHNHQHQHHRDNNQNSLQYNNNTPIDRLSEFDTGYESQSSDGFGNTRHIFAEHFGIVITNDDHGIGRNNNIVHNRSMGDTISGNVGKPLPNARNSPISINLLNPTEHCGILLNQQHQAFENKMLVPTINWTLADNKLLWNSMFNGAVSSRYSFFSFFMDRSLNVILKACIKAINSGSNETCFNQHVQDILLKKSYIYYGTLIKDLRESMANDSIENSTILLWFANWSLFIHRSSTLKAENLILTGSASLLWNCLNQYQSTTQLNPTLSFIIHSIKWHTLACTTPDYKFNVIEELFDDFKNFKRFILFNQELTTKNNGYILKSFVDLENFLQQLIENIYPRMVKLDNDYKKKYEVPSEQMDRGIQFFSPEELFSIVVNWFNIVPGYALSVGKTMTPLKRTYYLFYAAIAVALAAVFPSIRGVFLVDPWNMIFARTDFDNLIYKISPSDLPKDEQYQYLSQLSKKLLRVINFFTTRRKLLLNYLGVKPHPFLHFKYMEKVEPLNDYDNVVRFKTEKMDFQEVMITSFNVNNIINVSNYPLMRMLYNNSDDNYQTFKRVIEKENHDQKVRITKFRANYERKEGKNIDIFNSYDRIRRTQSEGLQDLNELDDFDYDRGMFLYDYNIEHALTCVFDIFGREGKVFDDIGTIKQGLENFELAQKEIAKCV